MKITMVGTGYVGLVSGVCFSDFGHIVTCVDKNASKIDRLNAGEIPIYEPGLEDIVRKNVKEGRLFFSTELEESVRESEAVFIAVGTPEDKETGAANLDYVHAAAEEIAQYLERYTVIATKSTVPVGTGDAIEDIVRKTNPAAKFDVVSNPEFLREGAAINDFKCPDRIVVGTDSTQARDVIRELYEPFNLNKTPLMMVNRRTSELIKYASNAFLATKITFVNEMADLCEQVGADIEDLSAGIGLDRRIGPKYLNVGPGYGGSCFPKDTAAIVNTARRVGTPLKIVEAVVGANIKRKQSMALKVIDAVGGDVRGKTVAILGLAFKPNTDDMRESPSIDIIEVLQANGAKIHAYDPEAMVEAKHVLSDVAFYDDAYSCAEDADVICIVTEWDRFKDLDFERLKRLVRAPVLVDLRNIYTPADVRSRGFMYVSLGRA